jgi:hypothetical protein
MRWEVLGEEFGEDVAVDEDGDVADDGHERREEEGKVLVEVNHFELLFYSTIGCII